MRVSPTVLPRVDKRDESSRRLGWELSVHLTPSTKIVDAPACTSEYKVEVHQALHVPPPYPLAGLPLLRPPCFSLLTIHIADGCVEVEAPQRTHLEECSHFLTDFDRDCGPTTLAMDLDLGLTHDRVRCVLTHSRSEDRNVLVTSGHWSSPTQPVPWSIRE